MTPQRIFALGSDHAGYDCKSMIRDRLLALGYELLDFGTDSSESVDYPDYIHPVAEALKERRADLGLIFCGSGNGVAMTANKHAHIRAALAWNEEIAALARLHNDANVLAVPARFLSDEEAWAIVERFIEERFEGGRHARRVDKMIIPDKSS